MGKAACEQSSTWQLYNIKVLCRCVILISCTTDCEISRDTFPYSKETLDLCLEKSMKSMIAGTKDLAYSSTLMRKIDDIAKYALEAIAFYVNILGPWIRCLVCFDADLASSTTDLLSLNEQVMHLETFLLLVSSLTGMISVIRYVPEL